MSVADQRTIEIENIGPIQHLSIPIPEDGGIVVLRGSNGQGKDHALDAIHSALSGDGQLACRDHTAHGSVKACGVTLSVKRSTRRSGELEVLQIEDRFDFNELVDPGLKDPERADAVRIKALCRITGAKSDPTAFFHLFGGAEKFGSVVTKEDIETDDLVEMAARIKRRAEAEARRIEKQAEGKAAIAYAMKKQVNEDAIGQYEPADELQRRLEEAIARRSALEQKDKSAMAARCQYQEAKSVLDNAQAEDRPSVSEWRKHLDNCQSALEAAFRNEDSLRKQLEQAEKQVLKCKHDCELTEQNLSAATQEDALIQKCRETLNAYRGTQEVDPEEMQRATNDVAAARQAIENAAVARENAKKQAEAASIAQEAEALKTQAQRLREAAKNTDDVLSNAIGGGRWKVDCGRLVTETDRGLEPYSELSHGERSILAALEKCEQVGRGGIMEVPQMAWMGLDPVNRQRLAALAKEKQVVIITAANDTDEPLHVEFAG